jgi:hypothetical protein
LVSGKLSSVAPDDAVTLITGGLYQPYDVVIDGSGNYIIADGSDDELLKVTPGGTVTLITSNLSAPRFIAIVLEPLIRPVVGIYALNGKLNILTPYIALVGLIGAVSTIFAIRRWYRD